MDDEVDWPEMVARVQRRDALAERALVEALLPQVYARISRLLPRRSEVEDLAQEVFGKVFANLSNFRGGVFPAWVEVITKRVCYDALRKQRVRPEWRFADFSDDPPETMDEGAPVNQRDFDAAGILQKLFTMLPAGQAYLLEQVELHERTIGEVAAELGWTAAAGRLRLLRARRSLKRVYQQWIKHEESSTN